MVKAVKGLVLASSSLIFVILYNLLMLSAAATALVILKHWVLPVYLLWMVFGTVVTLLSSHLVLKSELARRCLTPDLSHFEKPFWKWMRRRGVIPLAVLATWLGSSIVAAILLRGFALGERRIWFTALVSDLVVALVTALIYLGGSSLF